MSLPPLPTWISEQLPDGVRRERVDVGDVGGARALHLHVMRWGSGRPVLLVHGNPTWGFLWRKVVAELADGPFELIVPDLPGLGLSDRVPAGWHTVDHHTEALGRLIEALDLTDVIAGVQDWGGPIGVGAFVDRPERLGGLVVANTILGPPKESSRPTPFHRFSALPILPWLVFRLGGFPQNGLHRVQGDPSSVQGDVARAYRWPLRGLSRNRAPLELARMVPADLTHASVPALQAIAAFVQDFDGPAELVWGTKDPILGRLARRVGRQLPQAGTVLTEAGHFLQEEVPELLAQAVRDVHTRRPQETA